MAKSALLIMDVQPGILANLGADADAYLEKSKGLVEAAHSATIPVIFVVVRFRNGYPEVSPNNKMFGAIRSQIGPGFHEDSPEAQPAITPSANDFVVVKRRVSAFSGSDLEVVLRGQGIDSLILCGIATSGVVLSTLREAADKDYVLTVIEDACFDRDPEVHKVLTTKVFDRQATVVSAQEWIQTLGDSNH
jgi:nicotinamidase-related amidase